MEKEKKRQISLQRAEELKGRIEDFLEARKSIPTGISKKDVLNERKNRILHIYSATEVDWNDYRWQLKNRITDVESLSRILPISEKDKQLIREVGEKFRWAVSPYYLSLADPEDSFDPV